MDIISILFSALQSTAIFVIIIGMLIAFLWKAAFYLNLALGLMITFALTYVVYTIIKDTGAAATVFFILLICSIAAAAIGGLLCLLQGFFLSGLGFFALWASGSPSNILVVIGGSAIASAVSTGIAAFIGDKVLSLRIRRNRLEAQPTTYPTPSEITRPIEVEILPEETSSAVSSAPTPITTLKPESVSTADDLLAKKNETLGLLRNLRKGLIEEKISEETYKKLRMEFEQELEGIEKELKKLEEESKGIEAEIKKLQDEINSLESEKQSETKLVEELEARYLIKQITEKEYMERGAQQKTRIDSVNQQISKNKDEIIKLQRRRDSIIQILQKSTS